MARETKPKVPKAVLNMLFSAIDVKTIYLLKEEGADSEELAEEVENQLEEMVDALDTSIGFMGRYPREQRLLSTVQNIMEHIVFNVDIDNFVRRALRSGR